MQIWHGVQHNAIAVDNACEQSQGEMHPADCQQITWCAASDRTLPFFLPPEVPDVGIVCQACWLCAFEDQAQQG
jgi:hypothetical protein